MLFFSPSYGCVSPNYWIFQFQNLLVTINSTCPFTTGTFLWNFSASINGSIIYLVCKSWHHLDSYLIPSQSTSDLQVFKMTLAFFSPTLLLLPSIQCIFSSSHTWISFFDIKFSLLQCILSSNPYSVNITFIVSLLAQKLFKFQTSEKLRLNIAAYFQCLHNLAPPYLSNFVDNYTLTCKATLCRLASLLSTHQSSSSLSLGLIHGIFHLKCLSFFSPPI